MMVAAAVNPAEAYDAAEAEAITMGAFSHGDLDKLALESLTKDQSALLLVTVVFPRIKEHQKRTRDFARVPPIACVYFLRDAEGLIKIGWTKNLRKRVAALQVTSSSPLRLIGVVGGGRNTEQWLHARLGEHRVRGEWFRPSAKLDRYLLGEGFVP
jgi:hypothetical protein